MSVTVLHNSLLDIYLWSVECTGFFLFVCFLEGLKIGCVCVCVFFCFLFVFVFCLFVFCFCFLLVDLFIYFQNALIESF